MTSTNYMNKKEHKENCPFIASGFGLCDCAKECKCWCHQNTDKSGSCDHCLSPLPPDASEGKEEWDYLFKQAYECGKRKHDLIHLEPIMRRMKVEIDNAVSQARQQERERVRKIVEKSQWCQFCGDQLMCFGCESIPGRTMEENQKILLESLEEVKQDE